MVDFCFISRSECKFRDDFYKNRDSSFNAGVSNECACSYYGYIFSGRFVQSGRLSPVKRACDVQAGCCIFNRGWNLWGTFMVIFKHRIENGKNMAGRAH